MSWMTSDASLRMRSIVRQLGLTKVAMAGLRQLGYEALLTRSMRRAVQPGDCVWDVGANIGFYTRMFGELVAPDGVVHAFEPMPHTVARLREAVAGAGAIQLMPLALSDSSGEVLADPGDHEDAATARIIGASEGGEGVRIQVERGDELVRRGRARPPNLVKIDVEGHELAVLQGMGELLSRPELRHIFIEVHFAILHGQGRPEVPAEIERLLKASGFALAWVDQSHLRASRPVAPPGA